MSTHWNLRSNPTNMLYNIEQTTFLPNLDQITNIIVMPIKTLKTTPPPLGTSYKYTLGSGEVHLDNRTHGGDNIFNQYKSIEIDQRCQG